MSITKTINVVVAGTNRSGKASFIDAVSDQSHTRIKSFDNEALFGTLRISDTITVMLFPAPNGKHLNLLSSILEQEMAGLVVVVDSANPSSFSQVRALLVEADKLQIPYVVAANKQDLFKAVTIETLRSLLDIPQSIPILPCNAKEAESPKAILSLLLNQLGIVQGKK